MISELANINDVSEICTAAHIVDNMMNKSNLHAETFNIKKCKPTTSILMPLKKSSLTTTMTTTKLMYIWLFSIKAGNDVVVNIANLDTQLCEALNSLQKSSVIVCKFCLGARDKTMSLFYLICNRGPAALKN